MEKTYWFFDVFLIINKSAVIYLSDINADIVVIGGGAAGISAAIEAKQALPSANVIIAERLDRIGKKILATGNGRCNLSNKNLSENSYHGSITNAIDVISSTKSAEEFFSSLGVLCTYDSQGRIYPQSNSAATILNALRIKLSQLGITEICNLQINEIQKKHNRFILLSKENKIICRRIIIACGGYAAPSFGTDGSMIGLLRSMGYKITKICPAIAPLKVASDSLKGLKGVRVKGKVSAVANGKILREEIGEIQFTENSISGICVFNLAYFMSQYENKLSLKVDFMPEMSTSKIEAYLLEVRNTRSDCTLEDFLTGIFTKNLAIYLMKNSVDKKLNEKISTLQKNEIQHIADKIKSFEFKISGCSSWNNAQTTSGGISGICIDNKLESTLDKGLFFAGEILDVNGDCGGFNLEWAWSSGMWAGRNCAASLKIKEI